MRVKALPALGLMALLCGCAGGGANHVGNPLLLPGRAITNAISEAGYKARRHRVKDFAARNIAALHADIKAGGGSVLTTAMDLACVSPEKRAALTTELMSNPALYQAPDIEPLVVALMVHGD